MEPISKEPLKQVKPRSDTKRAPAKRKPAKRIPKNTFLKLSQHHALERILKRKGRDFTASEIDAEDYCTRVQALEKTHKWKFFKELEIGYIKLWSSYFKTDLLYYMGNLSIQTIRSSYFIKKLTLKFPQTSRKLYLSNEYLESIMVEICRTLQLEDLDFEIFKCENISVETLTSILTQIARSQIGLKKLSFNTQTYPQIDDEGLELIGREIGECLINLRSLDLCFNQRGKFRLKPTPDLEKYKNIKTPISDKGLKALGYYLGKRLKNLKHLAVHVYWVEGISDKGLKAFVSGIGKDLSHIQSLQLVFRGCPSLTGSGMKSTANEICKHFKNLKILDFSLDKCDSVFPNDVKAVKNKVKKELLQLKGLTLNSTKIEDI